jgi:hypothetical protein
LDSVAVWRNGCGHKQGRDCSYIRTVRIDRGEEKLYIDPCLGLSGKLVLLEYITDGSDCDAASKVHPYSQNTIEKYIIWKNSPNRDNDMSPEGRQYDKAEKNLRARFNDCTLEDIEFIQKRRTHIHVNSIDWLTSLNEN